MLENDESSLMVDEGALNEKADEFNQIYETTPMEPETKPESKWALRGRLRSKALWTSVAGVVMILFTALDLWDKIGITQERFQAILTAIGSLLTLFGILNDPTNQEAF